MIGRKAFNLKYDRYQNRFDRFFVWLCDEAEMSKWYEADDYWDVVLAIYEAGCYNSGVYISLDMEKKRFKKIHEETVSERDYERFKQEEHEKFINSIFTANDY